MLIVGIAGGSGSGKTLVARELASLFAAHEARVISQDCYYRDNSQLSLEQRKAINFDHPDAFDHALFLHQIIDLANGKPVPCPIYSYLECNRTARVEWISPPHLLVLEGILLFHDLRLLEWMSLRIFLEVPAPIRLERICKRDSLNRGRSSEEVTKRFLEVVQPMHEAFVESMRDKANLVIQNTGEPEEAVQTAARAIKSLLGDPERKTLNL